ncbi:hypothetical protein MC885_015508 [Smutsia gigantea]|nr:hypothetical protein MC885_015508 [Smutsia gigantea]
MEQLLEFWAGLGTSRFPEPGQAMGKVGVPTQALPSPLQADVEPVLTSGASEVVPRVLSGEPQSLVWLDGSPPPPSHTAVSRDSWWLPWAVLPAGDHMPPVHLGSTVQEPLQP